MVDHTIFENKTAVYYTLGCKLNFAETSAIGKILEEQGIRKARNGEKADICIINTCSVTELADKKCRQTIRKIARQNPGAFIVVTGCYAQLKPEEIAHIPDVDLVLGAEQKLNILDYLDDLHKQKGNGTIITTQSQDIRTFSPSCSRGDRTRYFLKVQDGCDYYCTYCTIPFARGRVRSRKSEDIVEEITGLAKAGYQEFVLTGIHISSYGIDFEEKGRAIYGAETNWHLLKLLEEVDAIPGVSRLRLGSLEPRLITEEFAQGIGKLKTLCPHFHLSLQSGSEATLKRMNRHYTPEEFRRGVELLRRTFEHPAVTTDVIVGFPQESEEEFEETRRFLEVICFYEMHIFKFSKRKGTRAAIMEGQIAEKDKTRRSNILLEMEKRQSKEFRTYYIGRQEEVLLEEKKEIDGREYWIGHTREYVKVALASDKDCRNRLVTGMIKDSINDEILILDTTTITFH